MLTINKSPLIQKKKKKRIGREIQRYAYLLLINLTLPKLITYTDSFSSMTQGHMEEHWDKKNQFRQNVHKFTTKVPQYG